MERKKDMLRIRIYIIFISAVRTLILLIAGVRGLGVYFPRLKAGYNLMPSIVVLIAFWFIAIFYNSVRSPFIGIVFFLDGIISYFYGVNMQSQYGAMTFYESLFFGHVITIVMDILLIAYLINRKYEQRKVEKEDKL